MDRSARPVPWRWIRLGIYVAVAAALVLVRTGGRDLFPRSPTPGTGDGTLRVAGADVAPALVPAAVRAWLRDEPGLAAPIAGGRTLDALEDLLNRRADVAFLTRPPSPAEQALARSSLGDTLVVEAVAVAGVLLLVGDGCRRTAIGADELIGLTRAEAVPDLDRLVCTDPDGGLWDALLAGLGLPPAPPPAPGDRLVFLRDAAGVLETLRADPRAAGVASSLEVPEAPGPPGIRTVPVRFVEGGAPVAPTYENVGTGEYPLHHRLWVACRGERDPEAAKFVTHLASGPGQRWIERHGILPARRIPHEIRLTRATPAGGTAGGDER